MRNICKNAKCRSIPFFAFLILLSSICGCFFTLKTARIAPKGSNIHAFSGGYYYDWAFQNDPFNNPGRIVPFSYSFRRGITDKLELGFGAGFGFLSFGGKYKTGGITALDGNLILVPVAGPGFFSILPGIDLAFIAGNGPWYGGINSLLMFAGDDFSSDIVSLIFPFAGREVHLFGRLSLLAEAGIGCTYRAQGEDDKIAALAAAGIGLIIEPKKTPSQ